MDTQILTLRLLHEAVMMKEATRPRDADSANAQTGNAVMAERQDEDDDEEDEGIDCSKVIVIHLGSQNMRIGHASDALPKTVPM